MQKSLIGAAVSTLQVFQKVWELRRAFRDAVSRCHTWLEGIYIDLAECSPFLHMDWHQNRPSKQCEVRLNKHVAEHLQFVLYNGLMQIHRKRVYPIFTFQLWLILHILLTQYVFFTYIISHLSTSTRKKVAKPQSLCRLRTRHPRRRRDARVLSYDPQNLWVQWSVFAPRLRLCAKKSIQVNDPVWKWWQFHSLKQLKET